jgi:hypothetical protein
MKAVGAAHCIYSIYIVYHLQDCLPRHPHNYFHNEFAGATRRSHVIHTCSSEHFHRASLDVAFPA